MFNWNSDTFWQVSLYHHNAEAFSPSYTIKWPSLYFNIALSVYLAKMCRTDGISWCDQVSKLMLEVLYELWMLSCGILSCKVKLWVLGLMFFIRNVTALKGFKSLSDRSIWLGIKETNWLGESHHSSGRFPWFGQSMSFLLSRLSNVSNI